MTNPEDITTYLGSDIERPGTFLVAIRGFKTELEAWAFIETLKHHKIATNVEGKLQ